MICIMCYNLTLTFKLQTHISYNFRQVKTSKTVIPRSLAHTKLENRGRFSFYFTTICETHILLYLTFIIL